MNADGEGEGIETRRGAEDTKGAGETTDGRGWTQVDAGGEGEGLSVRTPLRCAQLCPGGHEGERGRLGLVLQDDAQIPDDNRVADVLLPFLATDRHSSRVSGDCDDLRICASAQYFTAS